jgi:hypothetical protein
MRVCEWVVYAKRPFAGPKSVLAYLSRYTHRVAISNQRLVALDERGVTFSWKDYRVNGRTRNKTMTLEADEFMRRFLLHVLHGGFHRIRHYGLIANPSRRENLVDTVKQDVRFTDNHLGRSRQCSYQARRADRRLYESGLDGAR